MAASPDPASAWWTAAIPVVIGGAIAMVTAMLTQLFTNRSSRQLEDVKLKGVFAAEDYKNDPTRQIKDATRLLEQQLVFAKQTIAKLAREQRTGKRSIVWRRMRDLFSIAYDIHAPKATAMRLRDLYEDRVDSATRADETLWAMWQFVELLDELFGYDQEIASVAPVIEGYPAFGPDGQRTQYLAADTFAKMMIGTKGIASRGSFDQRLANGNKELVKALEPSRRVLTDFSPEQSPVLWRLLLCEAVLCDAIAALREPRPLSLNEWPSADTREQLRWADANVDAASDAEFAAARRFVQSRLRPFPRPGLQGRNGDATLAPRWPQPAGPG